MSRGGYVTTLRYYGWNVPGHLKSELGIARVVLDYQAPGAARATGKHHMRNPRTDAGPGGRAGDGPRPGAYGHRGCPSCRTSGDTGGRSAPGNGCRIFGGRLEWQAIRDVRLPSGSRTRPYRAFLVEGIECLIKSDVNLKRPSSSKLEQILKDFASLKIYRTRRPE